MYEARVGVGCDWRGCEACNGSDDGERVDMRDFAWLALLTDGVLRRGLGHACDCDDGRERPQARAGWSGGQLGNDVRASPTLSSFKPQHQPGYPTGLTSLQ